MVKSSCNLNNMVRVICSFVVGLVLLYIPMTFAVEVPIDHFSIKPYSQNISDYLPSNSDDYSTPLLTPDYQAIQLQQFYNHYYSSNAEGVSPWSEQMVNTALPVIKESEFHLIDEFNNQNQPPSKRHYGENFKEHDELWLNRMKKKMDLNAISSTVYKEENRAISVANTFARALPDMAPDFFYFTQPGEGFPFDNLQESVIWAGTPLYVVSPSDDHAWLLVLTPDGYYAWVKSNDVAYVSSGFINQWQIAARTGFFYHCPGNSS